MTFNKSQFQYALLAMDVYERPEINLEIPLGGELVKTAPDPSTGDFDAAAYKFGNHIVISYRGTDDQQADEATGWSLKDGVINAQVLAARQFYLDVIAEFPNAEISFTGHSMGGGLAGGMALLTGLEAVVFDTLPFNILADNMREEFGDPNIPFETENIQAFHIDGEIASIARGIEAATRIFSQDPQYYQSIGTSLNGVVVPDFVQNSLHSMFLMAIIKHSYTDNLLEGSLEVIPAFYRDDIAIAAGITEAVMNRFGEDITPHDTLMKAIVYSGSTLNPDISGDVAMTSLWNDITDIDNLVDSQQLNDDLDYIGALGSVVVLYAGVLAVNKAVSAEWAGYQDGVIDFNSVWNVLHVDLSDMSWTFNEWEPDEISYADEVKELIIADIFDDVIVNSSWMHEITSNGIKSYSSVAYLTDHSGVSLSMAAYVDAIIVGTQGQDNIWGAETGSVIFGSASGVSGPEPLEGSPSLPGDYLIGGMSDDIIIGSGGDDTIFGNDGSDTIIGGSGNDTLISGFGSSFTDGGSGDDTIYTSERDIAPNSFGNSVNWGGSGDDVFIVPASTYGTHIDGGDGDDFLYLDYDFYNTGLLGSNYLFDEGAYFCMQNGSSQILIREVENIYFNDTGFVTISWLMDYYNEMYLS